MTTTDVDDQEYEIDIHYGPMSVRDTQIYPGHLVSGGEDSDDELDLRMDEDESPLNSAAEEDESENDDSIIVSRAKQQESKKRARKTEIVTTALGGHLVGWSDFSRQFISYLSVAKLPI